MGKKKRRFKKRFIITESLLFILVVISSFLFFYFNNKYHTLVNKYNKYEMKILNNRERLKNAKMELDSYRDLNKKIDSVKEEYFSMIKKLEDDINSGKSNKKIVYLTFDDGPYYNTYRVLDILDRYNIGATFFTTNVNGKECHDNKNEDCHKLYKEYIRHGHTIANHTYTHAIFKGLYNSADSFMDAVIRQEDLINDLTGGYVTNIVRFPGGIDTAKHYKVSDEIIKKLKERGYGWVDWSSLDGDGGYMPSRDWAWNTLTKSLDDKIEVVLFHDYSSITTGMLPDAIEYLKNNNYIILPLFYGSSVINK